MAAHRQYSNGSSSTPNKDGRQGSKYTAFGSPDESQNPQYLKTLQQLLQVEQQITAAVSSGIRKTSSMRQSLVGSPNGSPRQSLEGSTPRQSLVGSARQSLLAGSQRASGWTSSMRWSNPLDRRGSSKDQKRGSVRVLPPVEHTSNGASSLKTHTVQVQFFDVELPFTNQDIKAEPVDALSKNGGHPIATEIEEINCEPAHAWARNGEQEGRKTKEMERENSFVARAIGSYTPEVGTHELAFSAGDSVLVHRERPDGWWAVQMPAPPEIPLSPSGTPAVKKGFNEVQHIFGLVPSNFFERAEGIEYDSAFQPEFAVEASMVPAGDVHDRQPPLNSMKQYTSKNFSETSHHKATRAMPDVASVATKVTNSIRRARSFESMFKKVSPQAVTETVLQLSKEKAEMRKKNAELEEELVNRTQEARTEVDTLTKESQVLKAQVEDMKQEHERVMQHERVKLEMQLEACTHRYGACIYNLTDQLSATRKTLAQQEEQAEELRQENEHLQKENGRLKEQLAATPEQTQGALERGDTDMNMNMILDEATSPAVTPTQSRQLLVDRGFELAPVTPSHHVSRILRHVACGCGN